MEFVTKLFQLLKASTLENRWPWMASIGFWDNTNVWNHQCGGSLISHYHVLTAAHCTIGMDKRLKHKQIITNLLS